MQVLSRKEKQIIELLQQENTYDKICEKLHVSPKTISIAKKKHEGRWEHSETKQVPNRENYSEIYKLFTEGKEPLQVARILNLPVDYVSKLFLDYLEAIHLQDIVKLYHECKEEGIEVLRQLATEMKKRSMNPKHFGAAVYYFQQYHQEGMKLEDVRKERIKVNESIGKRQADLEQVEAQILTKRTELADILTQKEAEAINRKSLLDEDKRLRQQYPQLTIVQIAVIKANEVLERNDRLLETALNTVLKGVKNSPLAYGVIFPEKLPQIIFSKPGAARGYQELCKSELWRIKNDFYNRLLEDTIRESQLSIDG